MPPQQSDHTTRLRELAEEFDDADEEVTGQTHVHVAPGGSVVVDQTGKFAAVEPRTRPDAAPAPVSTGPADPRVRGLGWLLEKFRPQDRVWVALALIVLLGLALWRGVVGAIAQLWP